MKKGRLAAVVLCAAMVTSMTACNVKTKSDVTSTAAPAADQGPTEPDPNAGVEIGEVNLKLLYQSTDESVANVIRDELSKAGINVEMSAASDGATFREQEGNGNFDIAISSWANPVGTPDYGCRGIHSPGYPPDWPSWRWRYQSCRCPPAPGRWRRRKPRSFPR